METIFINLTNHPSEKWGEKQINEANKYGQIIDMPFPEINPYWDEDEINELISQYYLLICEKKPSAVLCQGEFTFCYGLIKKLLDGNIRTLAACSERKTITLAGKKISKFEFVKFRKYV